LSKTLAAVAILLLILFTGCSIIDEGTPASKLPPIIEQFTVTPQEIFAGQSASLKWSVSGDTTTVVIEPGIGSIEPSGSIAVSPLQKQDYLLKASNKFGSVTSSLTVTVNVDTSQTPLTLPVINSFTAQPGHGPAGVMVELIWDTEDADTISIKWGDNNSMDFTAGKGSIIQQPVVSTDYILIAKNKQGVRATNLTVTVDPDLPNIGGSGAASGSCG